MHEPGEEWSIDLAGPFPADKHGNTYIVVAVDTFSRFVMAKAVKSTKAQGLAKHCSKMRCCALHRRRILLGFVHCWYTPRTSLPGSGISSGSLNPAHLTRFTCSF